jgi:hypothetical protein
MKYTLSPPAFWAGGVKKIKEWKDTYLVHIEELESGNHPTLSFSALQT